MSLTTLSRLFIFRTHLYPCLLYNEFINKKPKQGAVFSEQHEVFVIQVAVDIEESPMTSVHAANRRIAKSGAPTRDIAIQSNSTLYKLAAAIIDSFGFDFDHAFGFFSTDFKQPMFHQAKRQYELFTDMLTSNLPTREALRKPPSKKYGKRSAIKKKKYPYIVAKHGNAPQQYEY